MAAAQARKIFGGKHFGLMNWQFKVHTTNLITSYTSLNLAGFAHKDRYSQVLGLHFIY